MPGYCLALAMATFLTRFCDAQTIVSGTNISGTWSPSGNPYVITGDVTVPGGQTLTIQPGVVVWIGSNVTITAQDSTITAIGTPTQRIRFQAPASASCYWNTIALRIPSSLNQFHFCDFQHAQTAISLDVSFVGTFLPFPGANWSTEGAEILSCTFSNCVSAGVLATSEGTAGYAGHLAFWTANPTNNPVIQNCVFFNTGNGCVVNISGNYWPWSWPPGYAAIGYGSANPTICANIFEHLTGTAFSMGVGSYAGSGQATFLNNTIVGCSGGVAAADPWDGNIQGNIFEGVTNAVSDSGSLMRTGRL